MRDEDRVFLDEYAKFTCMTHPAAAVALYNAAADADRVAATAYGLTYRLDETEAARIAAERNMAALAQTYVTARLVAQLAAAIEDCGAMGEAIRHRRADGLFRRFLHCSVGQVGSFFDLVLRGDPLATLLDLPRLETMAPSPDRDILERSYATVGSALTQVARMYRAEGPAMTVTASPLGGPAPDVVTIVVDVLGPGSATAAKPTSTLPGAYNKIKHRFMVPQNIEPLGRAVSATGDTLVFDTYPRDPANGRVLLRNVATVAAATGEMAALVLALDNMVGLQSDGRRARVSRTSRSPRSGA